MPAYSLATGAAGSDRLDLVEILYGAQSREALLGCGLGVGMDVCDVGAGTGPVAAWMAERVGPSGSVTAVDSSEEQLALVRRRAADQGLSGLRTVHADATATGLPRGAFDLVFSRGMVNHLVDPVVAIREMVDLVRPGGSVIVADIDVATMRTMPPTRGYESARDLYLAFASANGRDYRNGARLPALLRSAGLEELDVSMVQPAHLRGDLKHLMSRTLSEARPHIDALGLETPVGFDDLIAAMEAAEGNDAVVVVIPAMTACWGRRPGGESTPLGG